MVLDRQVLQVQLVQEQLGHLDLQVLQDPADHKERVEPQERLGQQVPRGRQALKEQQVQAGQVVHRVLVELQVQLAHQDPLGLQEEWGVLVQVARQARRVVQE